ncbi:MAG: FAD-binding protein [Hyphomicrobiaceae bacterium]
MQQIHRPAADWELRTLLRDAAAAKRSVEVMGAGTKQVVGRAGRSDFGITTMSLAGVTLYEPSELVMSAKAGTPLAAIEKELARHNQMLAFEPIDLGPALGAPAQQGTIGAVFATNLSGARRIIAGAARDHILGVVAVTGAGEIIKSGGRVMKNVTGVDVARGLMGSWGTLAVMTETTFKVLPRPQTSATLAFAGLPDELAIEALCLGMGSPFEVTGAVHLQAGLSRRLWHASLRTAGQPITALRLENFESFIGYRAGRLKDMLKAFGEIQVLEHDSSVAFWDELRQLSVLQNSQAPLWRISTTAKLGPKVVHDIKRYMNVDAMYDWSGGLIWVEVPQTSDAGATDIRRVMAVHGGHATLIRAAETVRAEVDVFQPVEPGIERLTAKLKATFDPAGILNRGRMYAAV